MFVIKRIYEDADNADGFRVLVDRLWPRGISKEKAKIEVWLKEIAPSDDLRKWFGHDPKKWAEFTKKYHTELLAKKDLIAQLKKLEKENKKVTLLYGAKNTEYNQAIILRDILS